ncbi:MAG: LacI family DNA-binding transcriptional regulator [Lachnospiraceae bacterium]|nr:LacI family DNA-binding transcriptional regulator [Lachnospiraceae bacterium]
MVRIKDIAKECNVSPATVSKALNGYADVGTETAALIRKTAERLHYMPNAAARMLKTNISHNIGVVFEDETMSGLTHEYFSHILNSAKNELEDHGYDITFISQKVGGNSFLEHCRYRKVDGVLIASVDFTNPQVRKLVMSEFPTVTIDYSFDSHSCVMSDNVEGAATLVSYLYEMGHRKIAFIHGENTSVTIKRLSGFYKRVKELGLSVPEEYVLESRYHDVERTSERLMELLKLPDPPTAIMFPDDYSYIGCLQVFDSMHVSVPDDISIVGYDGIPMAQMIRPKLTTLKQDAEEIGRVSARKLIETIEHRKNVIVEELRVSGTLIEGGTVRRLSR